MSNPLPNKHIYLFKSLCGTIPTSVLNNVMDTCDEKPKIGTRTRMREKIITEDDSVEVPSLGVSWCGSEAFGNLALPVLKKQLDHHDINMVRLSLLTIYNLIQDPVKCLSAVRLGYVESLCDLLLHSENLIKEQTLLIYYVISSQLDGTIAIIRRYRILANLSKLLEDPSLEIQQKAHLIVERLSRHVLAVHSLKYVDYHILLVRLIDRSLDTVSCEIIQLDLMTLDRMLETDIYHDAMKHNCMEILARIAQSEISSLSALAMSCISKLCWYQDGKIEADKRRILCRLKDKLYDDKRNVYSKALVMFNFATQTENGVKIAVRLNIIERLLELSYDDFCFEAQVNALQIMCNLLSNAKVKKYLQKAESTGFFGELKFGSSKAKDIGDSIAKVLHVST